MRACPVCGWEIKAEAVKCHYCGSFIQQASSSQGEACWLCRVAAGVFLVLLMAGVLAFVITAGLW